MKLRDPFLLATLLSVFLQLNGCCGNPLRGTGDTAPKARADTMSYAELVFRLQNVQLGQLMEAEAVDAGTPTAHRVARYAAEDRLVENCRAMNDAASVTAAGGEISLASKLRVFVSLHKCRSAAIAAKAFLDADTPIVDVTDTGLTPRKVQIPRP